MTTLEEQAKWHEEQAKEHACFHAHHVVKGDDHEKSEEHKDLAARHRASAAGLRELALFRAGLGQRTRTDTADEIVQTSALTDRLLSEIPHA